MLYTADKGFLRVSVSFSVALQAVTGGTNWAESLMGLIPLKGKLL